MHLRDLAVSLAAAATAGSRPGEVGDGNDEEAVAGVGNTGKGVVPGHESRQQTEQTTGLLDLEVGETVLGQQVGDAEQEEGQVQEKEKQEEGDGGLQGAEDQNEGEDEPALGNVRDVLLSCDGSRWTRVPRLTIRNRPMERMNWSPRAVSMWNPPGVRTIAKAIQNPP